MCDAKSFRNGRKRSGNLACIAIKADGGFIFLDLIIFAVFGEIKISVAKGNDACASELKFIAVNTAFLVENTALFEGQNLSFFRTASDERFFPRRALAVDDVHREVRILRFSASVNRHEDITRIGVVF